jgi:hypothetical protein
MNAAFDSHMARYDDFAMYGNRTFGRAVSSGHDTAIDKFRTSRLGGHLAINYA